VRSPDERAYAGTLRLAVKRSSVFEDSFNKLRSKTPQEMRGKLSVAFVGEEGIDAGGVSREWYQVQHCWVGVLGRVFVLGVEGSTALQMTHVMDGRLGVMLTCGASVSVAFIFIAMIGGVKAHEVSLSGLTLVSRVDTPCVANLFTHSFAHSLVHSFSDSFIIHLFHSISDIAACCPVLLLLPLCLCCAAGDGA
jgi:hypothetical protein